MCVRVSIRRRHCERGISHQKMVNFRCKLAVRYDVHVLIHVQIGLVIMKMSIFFFVMNKFQITNLLSSKTKKLKLNLVESECYSTDPIRYSVQQSENIDFVGKSPSARLAHSIYYTCNSNYYRTNLITWICMAGSTIGMHLMQIANET